MKLKRTKIQQSLDSKENSQRKNLRVIQKSLTISVLRDTIANKHRE